MIKTVGEFVALISKMREAQRQYFRTRSGHDLNVSKDLEKKVDDEIKQFYERKANKKQPGLGLEGG